MLSRGLLLRRVIWMAAAAAMLWRLHSHRLGHEAQIGGVAVDAEGVVRLKSTADQTGQLSKQQQAAIRAGLNTKAAQKTSIRYISLKALEQDIKAIGGVTYAR